ncbi:MAG: Arylsulfatase [candidate division BRC1 bacterium ADurb.BinA364]|nr:MAG: Arylsulfatase [candidate division BRC1 bacterium ADurb.BinA364]
MDEKYAAPYRGLVPDGTANFYGMIANIDENVERLAKRLDTLGLSENTILVFMTDNGSSGGWKAYNAGMRGNKGSAYEGGHRVPFFIRWPAGNIGPARDVPNLASATDLLPTFVDLCELRLPRPVDFDGLSLAPLLRGKGEPPADRVVISGTQPNGPPVPHHNTAVMRGPWRLVNGKELYDISNDPAQERDESKRHPEIVAELQAAHDAWWRDVEPSFSDTPRIVLGDPRANPTWLTSWDLHGQSVYMQNQIEYGERADGYWEIEVASAGIYEIALRRWPAELDRPLNEGLQAQRIGKKGDQPSSVVKGANRARLCIAGLDLEQDIPLQAREAVFRVELPAGPARMQAWFVNTSTLGGATWGVYYARAAKE